MGCVRVAGLVAQFLPIYFCINLVIFFVFIILLFGFFIIFLIFIIFFVFISIFVLLRLFISILVLRYLVAPLSFFAPASLRPLFLRILSRA